MKVLILFEDSIKEFVEQELVLNKIPFKKSEFGFIVEENDKTSFFLYTSQTLKDAIKIVQQDSFKDFKDLISKIKIRGKITCERSGVHDFNSYSVEKELEGEGTEYLVLIKDNNFLIGEKIFKKSPEIRQYKIFQTNYSLKGTIAFSAFLFANKPNFKVFLDPFSLDGMLPIEIALNTSKMPVNYYDKTTIDLPQKILDLADGKSTQKISKKIYCLDPNFKNLKSQKKNAKIAGVEKVLEFGRVQVKDLDLKFFEEKPDLIITRIQEPSKKIPEKVALKNLQELMNAINIIKSKDCVIVFIMRKKEFIEKLKLFKFNITSKEVLQGNQKLYLVKLK